jgi:hypothetical protein
MKKTEEDVDAIARALFRAHDDAVCIGYAPLHDYDAMAESSRCVPQERRSARWRGIGVGQGTVWCWIHGITRVP